MLPAACALFAALPKERRRYDSKCKELTKLLQQKVAQYSNLLPFGELPGRIPPCMNDLQRQQFCWVEEYAGVCRRALSMKHGSTHMSANA